MADIGMRQAVRADCGLIARLYSMSSDGVADYVWSTLAEPGEDLLDVGRRRYEREDTLFSYQNCLVAEQDGQVVGMLVAFPMVVDPDYREEDPVLAPYAELEADGSYYICGVAVLPAFRGRGIGRRFMRRAEEDARARRLASTSLIVFAENQAARRLYEDLGYLETRRAAVVPHPLIRVTGEAILMEKALT